MVCGWGVQQQQRQQRAPSASPHLSPPLPLFLVLFLPSLPGLCSAVERGGWPRCWGDSRYGMSNVPSMLSREVDRGYDITCGIDMTRDVWCVGGWGYQPVVMPSDLTVSVGARQVVVGTQFVCVLLTDASVKCFGSARHYHYGQTTVPQSLGPVRQLSAGSNFACALEETGKVTCWGLNRHGQATPPSGLNATEVFAGDSHACALLTSGSARCWGRNSGYGQSAIPAELAERGITQLALGNWHTCALLEDASVSCWGRDDLGQTNVPSGLGPVVRIGAGTADTCALQQDGTIACWGRNDWSVQSVPLEIQQQAPLQLSVGWTGACVLLAGATTTTTSSSTTWSSTTSTTSTTSMPAQCLDDSMLSCAVPPGAYKVQGALGDRTECSLMAEEGEAVVFINTSSCPPNRTFHLTTVVDAYVLEPIVAKNLRWLDPSRPMVLCSCVSPRNGSARFDLWVPTPAPVKYQPGTGTFEPTLSLCADVTCHSSAAAVPPGAGQFHFRLASDDTRDEIEVQSATTCPGPDPEAPECETLVSNNCALHPQLQMSFRRDGHRVLWSMTSFAWRDHPTVHIFVQTHRCETGGICGVCATDAPEGGGRRMQSSPPHVAPLARLELMTNGDESVRLVPFPHARHRSGSVRREVQVPLLAEGDVGSDALASAAIAGLGAVDRQVQVTGVALLRQQDSQAGAGLVLSISLEVPVPHVQDDWQLDTAVLTELLTRLGFVVAAPTSTSTAEPAPGKTYISGIGSAGVSGVWALLLGSSLCHAAGGGA